MLIRPLLRVWLAWLLVGSLASAARSQTAGDITPASSLIANLQAEKTETRRAAALELRQAGAAVQLQTLPVLIDRLLNEQDGQVRLAVFDTVTALGPAAEPAVPALLHTLRTRYGGGGAEESHQDYRSALALAAIGPAAVPGLRDLLKESKENVRAEAIMALGRIGPASSPALPDLVPLLGLDSDRIGRDVVEALAAIGPPAVEPLLAASQTDEPVRRARAISSLGKLRQPDERVEAAVIRAATDPAPAVRAVAMAALSRFSPADAVVLPILRAGLRDPDEAASRAVQALLMGRRDWLAQLAPDLETLARAGDTDPASASRAAFLLGRLGLEGASRLIAALAGPASPIPSIGLALARIGPPVVPVVVGAIQNSDPRVRRGAALALGQIRPGVAESLPRLLPGLDDPDAAVRGDFLAAIGHLGARARDAVPEVRLVLHDPSAANRRQAIAILARSAPRDDRLVADLTSLISDPVPRVQQAAIQTLQTLGPPSRSALRAVLGVATSPDHAVRLAVVEFIASHGGAAVEAVPTLADLLADLDGHVRYAAAESVGKLGKPAQAAYPRLVPLLHDASPMVREIAALAVGNLEVAAATLRPDLVPALGDEKLDVRKAALKSITRLGPAGAIFLPDLIALAAHKENAKLIERSLRTFERTGPDPRSVPELAALLAHDAVAVRLLAVKFLGLAGPTAQDVLPALVRIRDDPSAEVRQQVKIACTQIQPDAKSEPAPTSNSGDHP